MTVLQAESTQLERRLLPARLPARQAPAPAVGRRCTDHPYRRPDLVLALGGGSGLRGLCHLGVLETFEQARLPVDLLLGVGAGAIVGAAYALDPSAGALRDRTFGYLLSERFRASPLFRYFAAEEKRRLSFFQTLFGMIQRFVRLGSLSSTRALVGAQPLIELVEAIVPAGEIAHSQIPLRLAALDLKTGKEVVLSQGNAREAALACASLSCFFPPVAIGEFLLVDHGFLLAVPVNAARAESRPGDVVVAVDISDAPAVRETYENALDVVLRVHHSHARLLNDQLLDGADVALRPRPDDAPPPPSSPLNAERLDGLVEAGRRAAQAVLPALRRRMLTGAEQVLAALALRHGFVDDSTLDACVREALAALHSSLVEVFYQRRVTSPQILGAMIELVHRKLALGQIDGGAT